MLVDYALLQNMVKEFMTEREVVLFCDLHGHSRKKWDDLFFPESDRTENKAKVVCLKQPPCLLFHHLATQQPHSNTLILLQGIFCYGCEKLPRDFTPMYPGFPVPGSHGVLPTAPVRWAARCPCDPLGVSATCGTLQSSFVFLMSLSR
eukprot:366421-Chlamydomonas_euryale.AAC.17